MQTCGNILGLNELPYLQWKWRSMETNLLVVSHVILSQMRLSEDIFQGPVLKNEVHNGKPIIADHSKLTDQ